MIRIVLMILILLFAVNVLCSPAQTNNMNSCADEFTIEPIDGNGGPNFGQYCSLSEFPTGPAVVYRDDGNDRLKFARLVNGSWLVEDLASGGIYPSLIELSDGTPAVSYVHLSNLEIVFARRESSSQWTLKTVATLSFSEAYEWSTSLALIDGLPSIAYYQPYGTLWFVQATSSSGLQWNNPLFLGSGNDFGRYPQISVLSDGRPIILSKSFGNLRVNIGKNSGFTARENPLDMNGGGFFISVGQYQGVPVTAHHAKNVFTMKISFPSGTNVSSPWLSRTVHVGTESGFFSQTAVAEVQNELAVSYISDKRFPTIDLTYATTNGDLSVGNEWSYSVLKSSSLFQYDNSNAACISMVAWNSCPALVFSLDHSLYFASKKPLLDSKPPNVLLIGDDVKNDGSSSQLGYPVDYAKLIPGVGVETRNDAQFGTSVAFSGDGSTALVGASRETANELQFSGAVYVYTRSTSDKSSWEQQARLTAGNGFDVEAEAEFGYSVALSGSGSVALVGSYSKDEGGLLDAGAAYVFVRDQDNWSYQAKLVAGGGGDLKAGAEFGRSVALSDDGTIALVGAARHTDGNLTRSGAAYTFSRLINSTWVLQAKLLPNDVELHTHFGWSVSLSGDGTYALVGSVVKNHGGTVDAGAAYVFNWFKNTATWLQESKLLAGDGIDVEANAHFGYSVSLSGSGLFALVGAYYKDEASFSDSGAAYLFGKTSQGSWNQLTKLTAGGGSDLQTQAFFGVSVSLSYEGETSIVGAFLNEEGAQKNVGAAYVFSNWETNRFEQQFKIILSGNESIPTSQYGHKLGRSVSLSRDGSLALIGANQKREGGHEVAGAAYILCTHFPGCPLEHCHADYCGPESLVTSPPTSSQSTYNFQYGDYAKIIAGNGDNVKAWAQFGGSVALSGDGSTAIVGAHRENVEGAQFGGAVYIFARSSSLSGSWIQQARFTAGDGLGVEAGAEFGFSVCLSYNGSVALVSAWLQESGNLSDVGAVYAFERNPLNHVWSLHSKIPFNDTSAEGARFGKSISLSSDGTVALIGASHIKVANFTGAAYLFSKPVPASLWSMQAKLLPDMTSSTSITGFGWCVSLSSDGKSALIGSAYNDEGSFIHSGAAYVFANNDVLPKTWYIEAKLLPGDLEAHSVFGESCSLSGDGSTALVGADFKNENGLMQSGAAYIFARSSSDSWSQRAKLNAGPGDIEAMAQFGISVAISYDGTTAAVGAFGSSVGEQSYAGGVYIFHDPAYLHTYEVKMVLGGSESLPVSEFGPKLGRTVSLSDDGSISLLSAPHQTIGDQVGAGAVYVLCTHFPGLSLDNCRPHTLPNDDNNNILGKILASDTADAMFGYSVSLSGDGTVALVGAFRRHVGDNDDAGAAYVFTRNSTGSGDWKEQAKLTAGDGNDTEPFAHFGWSVSLSVDGMVALIGARHKMEGNLTRAGAAYVFTRPSVESTEWLQQAKLTAGNDAKAEALFGFSVSLSSDGSLALVGAKQEDVGNFTQAGAVYVFGRSSGSNLWQQHVKLTAGEWSDLEVGAWFGCSVSLSGDGTVALVGAHRKDNVGASYVFKNLGSWSQQTKLTVSGLNQGAAFGNSVSLSKDGLVALVSAERKTEDAVRNAGASYVFVRPSLGSDLWSKQAKLTAGGGADVEVDAYFGYSCSLSNDGTVALVGAWRKDESGVFDAGASYVFRRNSSSTDVWTQKSKLTAGTGTDLEAGAYFGVSSALSSDGTVALVGANEKDEGNERSAGAVYSVCTFSPGSCPLEDCHADYCGPERPVTSLSPSVSQTIISSTPPPTDQLSNGNPAPSGLFLTENSESEAGNTDTASIAVPINQPLSQNDQQSSSALIGIGITIPILLIVVAVAVIFWRKRRSLIDNSSDFRQRTQQVSQSNVGGGHEMRVRSSSTSNRSRSHSKSHTGGRSRSASRRGVAPAADINRARSRSQSRRRSGFPSFNEMPMSVINSPPPGYVAPPQALAPSADVLVNANTIESGPTVYFPRPSQNNYQIIPEIFPASDSSSIYADGGDLKWNEQLEFFWHIEDRTVAEQLLANHKPGVFLWRVKIVNGKREICISSVKSELKPDGSRKFLHVKGRPCTIKSVEMEIKQPGGQGTAPMKFASISDFVKQNMIDDKTPYQHWLRNGEKDLLNMDQDKMVQRAYDTSQDISIKLDLLAPHLEWASAEKTLINRHPNLRDFCERIALRLQETAISARAGSGGHVEKTIDAKKGQMFGNTVTLLGKVISFVPGGSLAGELVKLVGSVSKKAAQAVAHKQADAICKHISSLFIYENQLTTTAQRVSVELGKLFESELMKLPLSSANCPEHLQSKLQKWYAKAKGRIIGDYQMWSPAGDLGELCVARMLPQLIAFRVVPSANETREKQNDRLCKELIHAAIKEENEGFLSALGSISVPVLANLDADEDELEEGIKLSEIIENVSKVFYD